MSLLEIDIAVGDLARVARIRMRTRGRLRHGQGGLDARHNGRRKEKKNAASLDKDQSVWFKGKRKIDP